VPVPRTPHSHRRPQTVTESASGAAFDRVGRPLILDSVARSGRLVSKILTRRHPWLTLNTNFLKAVSPTEHFSIDTIPQDKRLASLYVLLSIFHTDYTFCMGQHMDSRGVRGFWHEMTSGLFEKFTASNLPVTTETKDFVAKWLQGGYSTVERSAKSWTQLRFTASSRFHEDSNLANKPGPRVWQTPTGRERTGF
jgi:hypothetical protein